jgi:hypothetical protein
MRRPRLLILVAPVLIAATACSSESRGPVAPIAPAQLTPGPALDASAARQTVVDFVEAYRASPEQGVGPLFALVAGEELAEWVRWLDVQHREFEGEIEGASDVRDVEFVGSVMARRSAAAQVGLSASVTFNLAPIDGEDREVVRVLDGPVTLVRTDVGDFRVFDLLRNGVPMSDGIEPFTREQRTEDGVTVRLESLFMFSPLWQFNVTVSNTTDEDVVLDPTGAALFLERGEEFERVDGQLTNSLAIVPAGTTIDGQMVFDEQSSAEGRVLSLVYGSGPDRRIFEFPLGDLVTAVPPPPPPTSEDSEEGVPS